MQRKVSIVLGLALLASASAAHAATNDWTVLIYGGVDSSAEEHILPHLRSLGYLSKKGRNAEVVLLYDRAAGFTEDAKLFGENFEDTRLFRLGSGKWDRVSGGDSFPEITLNSTYEANTGDAETLAKFIRFGKSQYPAKQYLLIVFGHGSCRSVCPDLANPLSENGRPDEIFVGEMTDVLTEEESVDVVWFDVCAFGGIENAYQLRPGNGRFSTKVLIATPPSSSPAPMRNIFKKAGFVGKAKQTPADGLAFGKLMIELTEKHLRGASSHEDVAHEAWGCYDLTFAEAAKKAVDQWAVALAAEGGKDALERIRGSGTAPTTMHYMGRRPGVFHWAQAPHFDLYDLASRAKNSAGFSANVRSKAASVVEAVDQLIVASLGMSLYDGFENGRNGLFVVFPDGDAKLRSKTQWASFRWYHPDEGSQADRSYGKLSWCRDGATRGNGVVENWFELLDSWFDTEDDNGGVNGYRW